VAPCAENGVVPCLPPAGFKSVGGWMKVGIFPADPRGIASPDAEVVGVSLKLRVEIEAFVPLVISATKMLILNMVVRQPAMYPQVVVSGVSCRHRRGNSGGKNSHHAQYY